MIYIADLNSADKRLDYAGGKAKNLGHLMMNGVDVPAGFVILSNAFEQFRNTEDFSWDFKEELKQSLKKLNTDFVMVRSSAIGEDGDANSFAGQLDSFQSEKTIDEVILNIKKCWDSGKGQRVLSYQEQKGIKLGSVCVVIQTMIDPDYSGVLFTSSPIDQEEVLIEYVEGHAEKLVQGEVTPDTISLGRDGENLPETPFDLAQLLMVKDKILTIYGNQPQDIEWVYKSGKVSIVQTRPITTIVHKLSWSNTNVNENYPNKLSPLLYSIARRSYYHYFKNLAKELHVLPKDEGHAEQYFSNIIGLWGQKMYYNMTSIHKVISLTPLKALLKNSFDDFVGYQKNSKGIQNYKNKLSLITFSVRLMLKYFSLPKKVLFIEKIVDDFSKGESLNNQLNQYATTYHRFLDIRFNQWINASYADLFAMISHGVLGKLCFKIDSKNGAGLQNGLIQSIPNLVSNEPIFKIWEIAVAIRSAELENWFLNQDSNVIWEELGKQPENKVNQLIFNYLKHYGFRCSGELTFLSENYIEKPESFIQMLKLYLTTTKVDPNIVFEQKHSEQLHLLEKTKKLIENKSQNILSTFVMKKTLSFLVRFTCYYLSCRERVRMKQAKMYHHFKQTCLKVGALFVENKLINEQKDIFFLEFDELSRLLYGEYYNSDSLNELIYIRKKKFEAELACPDNFTTQLGDFSFSKVDQDFDIGKFSQEGFYQGLPACGGVIKAKVRVLESVHEIAKIQKGDILVTQQTDPGWIYVFPLISGLIVERGGMLSHGAIVAREFGIPAVVGVKNITQYLKDDQVVTLNGDIGVIQC